MNIYMIWARDDLGNVWLLESWDEDSIDGNEAGWDSAKQKARTEQGAENIRVVKAALDIDAVLEAFDPPKTAFGAVSVAEKE